MNDILLSLQNVVQTYGSGESAVQVLKGADLTVRKGEIIALVAPSGAGKSTLLHICGLLERPSEGSVTLSGMQTSKLDDKARTLLRRNHIGYIYQFHHLLPEFSALENIMMPLLIAGIDVADAQKRGMELLELMGIAHRAEHRPAELSGGEQQRVAIARASANNPKLILADEPTGNLDPATSDKVFSTLTSLVREFEVGCIMATHNYELARRADRIVTVRDGIVVPHQL